MARAPNPDRGKFEVVASPHEIRRWLSCAEAEDRSLSAWVRRACDEAAGRTSNGASTSGYSATEVMLCWIPGTSDVRLVPLPCRQPLRAAYSTALGCYRFVQEMNREQLQAHVFSVAMSLIVRDNCDPQAVHRALLGVAEYRDGCAVDMPGI